MDSLLAVGNLGPLEVALLVVAALATSALSAVVGMAGGITLLAIMLLFLDPLVAIPLLAVVQLVSNGSRALVHRENIQWSILWPYLLPLLPLGWLSLGLAERIPPDMARMLIGAFVLVATWRPTWILLGTHPERSRSAGLRFFGLGTVVGVLNVTLGATGPLIAPFFLNIGLSRFAIIGTKAACQMGSHIAKIVVFGIAGFAYGDWLGLLVLLCGCVMLGTLAGTRLLGRVDELWFQRLYKGVLTLIALRLVVVHGLDFIAP